MSDESVLEWYRRKELAQKQRNHRAPARVPRHAKFFAIPRKDWKPPEKPVRDRLDASATDVAVTAAMALGVVEPSKR